MRSLLTIVLLVSTVAVLAGCESNESPAQATPAATRAACASPVDTGPLPEWARTGFSGDSSMPHVMGDRGDLVAAIFGYPLAVSRPEGPSNKILWVPKVQPTPGDLVIEAKLDGSDVSVTRRVQGGPGPSIIDLPKAGCWHLNLSWPGHTDTMGLVYG
ncbi:hypothetical protein DFJ67_7504 [Asanoa ferruginea]|uniref:Secreted protein n=1 Tax=Asanoa ferruginea TaxID=53367 RepID=A0A3D9ZWL6_9ACTN|nr:hypothetical protein [Asanoa ferruginea]REG01420.1 hypothetical protein DFJ67_7504 [Asanoa ferruginea]GIF47954.1 hypothetical protein Afe04nite_24930 [Asanoa ferruginea]